MFQTFSNYVVDFPGSSDPNSDPCGSRLMLVAFSARYSVSAVIRGIKYIVENGLF